ncbi:MAG: flagellar FlbD family protein [bacterium]
MIEVTRLNGAKLVINSDLIEYIEAIPDTIITLTTNRKIMVQEKIPEICAAIIQFRRLIQLPNYTPLTVSHPDGKKDEQNSARIEYNPELDNGANQGER